MKALFFSVRYLVSYQGRNDLGDDLNFLNISIQEVMYLII